MPENNSVIPKDLTNYLKHYGFFFPNAEIYGGLAKAWDLGPHGAELKRKLKNLCSEQFLVFLSQRDKNNYQVKKKCPHCGKNDFHPPRQFNLLLTTNLEITEDKENVAYLRPETCQGIFTNFALIQRSTHRQLPFGVGQIGKSFRNEITLHHGIFRTREFEQMELEFFCESEERELCSNSHRGNYDLSQHSQHSQKDLRVNGIIPEVIEISFGVERLILAILQDAYHEEKVSGSQLDRTVLRLPPLLAPFFVAIIPLSQQLRDAAYQLYLNLLPEVSFSLTYEEAPNIGKAYRRQDAIGTIYGLTVDFDTVDPNSSHYNTLTCRHRDSMEQIRISRSEGIGDDKITKSLSEITIMKENDLKQLILGNRGRLKTTKRFLNDKMKSKRLTEAEKAEVRKELESVDMKIDEVLQEQNLSELAKTNPTFISKFYQLFYEQGKALVRAKAKASFINQSTEELKRQQKFQDIWDISKTEEKAITAQLKT
ncbi:11318_t:CDS:2 [Racocetra fulgida]|uniref:11318_t:CDS:1 n=1 Tax=Racocetra fulgida TaxID=60492 RepID=A0A9N8V960_9GLOM|nr:11318_t:CDS:2 [Racocetra fulgida]